MAKNKVKKYKRLRKMHSWPAIIAGFVVLFITIAVIGAGVDLFVTYATQMKVENEYVKVIELKNVCESVLKNDGASYESLLDDFDMPFYVFDKNGNEVFSRGENTIGEGRGKFSGLTDEIILYNDDTFLALTFDEDGDMVVNWDAIPFMIDEAEKRYDKNEKSFILPLWVREEMINDNYSLFAKIEMSVMLEEAFYILLFVAVSALIAILPAVILIVNAITFFSNQKKIIKVMNLDMITEGHNWTWYLINTEKILANKHKDKYAVMDVVFVNYRNYCMCHSISDGEEMLKKVNKTIAKELNKKEHVAHYASANFAVLMKYEDEEKLSERIKNLIKKLETIDTRHNFSFHVGIRTLDSNITKKKSERKAIADIEKLYNDACAARTLLADSDDSGMMFFSEKILEDQKWVDTVIDKADFAISNEEFVVYYQPKYNPNTGELKGCEALIRWDSPDFGFLPPGRFIPILEKNGYITGIDHYMLEHVAKQQAKWVSEGRNCVPISVNISRAHFIERDLATQIVETVDACGCEHELIEIELTESAFFDDRKSMLTTIATLRDEGFLVSMDDFGSGYSSLNSLKDLPLDILKLDAGFFDGGNKDGRGEIVVSEAIKLAKNLNMQTVAEGIEKEEQVEFLKKMGCDMIQGFYYARPMPPEEFEQKM